MLKTQGVALGSSRVIINWPNISRSTNSRTALTGLQVTLTEHASWLAGSMESLTRTLYHYWFQEKGGEVIIPTLSQQDIMEMGKVFGKSAIANATPEERLQGLSPQERLQDLSPRECMKHFSARERLEDLSARERLENLSARECLEDLSADEIRAYLKQLSNDQT